jgi:dinuclear metal center YbgI/SA1388 family protein
MHEMKKTALKDIVRYCDRLLRINEFEDYEGAYNGLQVENSGHVTKIAAAVDASLSTIKLAIEVGAVLLVVHHGIFWSARQPWTGLHYKLLRLLVEKNMAIYSAHLPLDLHPTLGNNAQFARKLALTKTTPFFLSHNQNIGLQTTAKINREELLARVERVTGTKAKLIPGGPENCRKIGIVTGGAGGELAKASAAGIDTFITGEGPHWSYALAEELGLNVIYAGHYATETFGVKALAENLSKKFKLPWEFVDYPTGL